MRYFDCHADTLTEIAAGESLWQNTCDLDLKRAKAFAAPYGQIFALWKNRSSMAVTHPEAEFRQLYRRAAELLHREEAQGRLVWCRTGADMEKAHAGGKAAAFLSVEDVSIMGTDVEKIRELGIRFAMLTWNYENEYGCGAATDQTKGLTQRGKAAVKELLQKGIIADISHLSDKGTEDLFELTDKPAMASHSDVREVCGSPRNLKKEQIQELIRRKGLIGMNFYRDFVGNEPTITDVLWHMDAVLSLGGEDILALGGDFDGCSGVFPEGICGIQSVPGLRDAMTDAGFGEKLTEKIFFGNAADFMRRNVW